MNILWDFRLFSYGYRDRGVGEYTRRITDEFIQSGYNEKLFILGDKDCMPELPFNNIHLINYKKSNWKNDLINIPLMILLNKIDVYHYWIALGPLRHMGMGLFHPCKTVATIYDLGVEQWNVPFLKSVKSSWYWSVQKNLFSSVDKIMSISKATSVEVKKVFPLVKDKVEVVYMPVQKPHKKQNCKRERYFITLGGSIHKNVSPVVKAFEIFNKKVTDFKLIVLGEINRKEEDLDFQPENVVFEKTMEHYWDHLNNSSGLIFCSVYEGLGIPPIDAMNHGCPLLVSDIPSLKETCSGAAIQVNPFDIAKITEGMLLLTQQNELWSEKSSDGALEYRLKTKDSIKKLKEIYSGL